MPKVEVYTKTHCPYCVRAKALLDSKGVKYIEIPLDEDLLRMQEMQQRSGRRTVPQIFIDDQHIGGCDDLYAADKAGKLNPLLKL
jgi:glutaredoxin 3